MGRKAGLDRQAVVSAAAELADAAGGDAVTLSAVAHALGVQPPSLYAHVSGLPGLRREMALLAASRLGEALTAAAASERAPETRSSGAPSTDAGSPGVGGLAAVRRICVAYRSFARAHPGLYAMAQQAVAPGEDDELYAVLAAAVQPVLVSLAEAGVPPSRQVHYARALRSALHGFVQLELGGGFGMPASVDESFHEMVELLIAGVTSAGRVEA